MRMRHGYLATSMGKVFCRQLALAPATSADVFIWVTEGQNLNPPHQSFASNPQKTQSHATSMILHIQHAPCTHCIYAAYML